MNNNINLSNTPSSPLSNVVETVSNHGWLYVLGIVALVVIAAIGYVYVTYKDSPWFAERAQAGWLTMDWLRAEPQFGLSSTGTLKETAPAPAVLPPNAPPTTSISERTGAIREREKKPETWCFVGEDLVGRWCVGVPKSDLCPRERSFASRSDCEMTPANHMPAGLVQNNGASMLPLAKATIA